MSVLVLVGPLIELATDVTMHWLARGSLDHALHAGLLLQALALQALLLVNGLMLGAALGRLRSLTCSRGPAATILLLLVERVPPRRGAEPLSLLYWQWSGAGIRRPTPETVRTQAAVTVVGARRVARVRRRRQGTRQLNVKGPVTGAIRCVATTGRFSGRGRAHGAALCAAVDAGRASRPSSYQFSPSPRPVSRRSTIGSRIRGARGGAALALAAEADASFEQVHALLGVPPGRSIDVDASGSAPTRTARPSRALADDAREEVAAVLATKPRTSRAQRLAGAERGLVGASGGRTERGARELGRDSFSRARGAHRRADARARRDATRAASS